MPGRTDSTRAVAITPPKPALKILSRARSGWFKYLFLAVDASTSLPALPDGENNDKERTRNPWEQGLSWCGAKMDHLPWLSQTKSTISSLRAPAVQLNKNISTSGCCLESDNRMFFQSVSIIGVKLVWYQKNCHCCTKQYSALLWSPLSRARGKSRWRGQPGTCRALPPGWQGRTVEIWSQIDIESMLKTQSYLRIITFGFYSSTPMFQSCESVMDQ